MAGGKRESRRFWNNSSFPPETIHPRRKLLTSITLAEPLQEFDGSNTWSLSHIWVFHLETKKYATTQKQLKYSSCLTISFVDYLYKESLSNWHKWYTFNLKGPGQYAILARFISFCSERASIINKSITLTTNIILGFYSGTGGGHRFILIKY